VSTVAEEAPLRLLADVGATNIRFGLCPEGGSLCASDSFACAEFDGIESAARAFLERVHAPAPPDQGFLAVAGPVTGDTISLTNHAWRFSIGDLSRALGMERLVVVNDFTAVALSLPYLAPEALRRIGAGSPVAETPMAVIGPGTGLGVSALIPAAGSWVPIAGEGGHRDFAAHTEDELALLHYLWARHDHVSLERTLSGAGLLACFLALGGSDDPAPGPASISAGAAAGDPIASAAVGLFSEVLGAAAGDLALTFGARGGVFIAGGIVPKLGAAFDAARFRDRFEAKGRFSDYLAEIPTYLITAEAPALVGLAHHSAPVEEQRT
jgi:glucokinase